MAAAVAIRERNGLPNEGIIRPYLRGDEWLTLAALINESSIWRLHLPHEMKGVHACPVHAETKIYKL